MRIAISGSRTFTDAELVGKVVDRLIEQKHIILVGDCPTGVDAFVRRQADKRRYSAIVVYRADWDKYGRSAGTLRNGHMISQAQFLVAMFADGRRSFGTNDAVRRAKAKGIGVKIYHEGEWSLWRPSQKADSSIASGVLSRIATALKSG